MTCSACFLLIILDRFVTSIVFEALRTQLVVWAS